MDNRKKIIAAIIVIVLIVIIIVAFLIYRNNKKRREQEAQDKIAILQAQLAQQPNMPASQKQSILSQIGDLAAIIMQNKANSTQQQSTKPVYDPESIPAPAGFPLKKGSTGNYVKDLQKVINFKFADKLKSAGMAKLSTDGQFGTLTEKAVALCFGTTSVSWIQYQKEITPIIAMANASMAAMF